MFLEYLLTVLSVEPLLQVSLSLVLPFAPSSSISPPIFLNPSPSVSCQGALLVAQAARISLSFLSTLRGAP